MTTDLLPSDSTPVELNSAVVATAITPSTESTLIDIQDFQKVQLRVGRIESAEAVPKSKKLLRLMVNLGPDLGTRQILSGISPYYTPESLIGKQVAIVANLKPATLMGLESNGMLLAAADETGTTLKIIEIDPAIAPGSTVR